MKALALKNYDAGKGEIKKGIKHEVASAEAARLVAEGLIELIQEAEELPPVVEPEKPKGKGKKG